MHACDTSAAPRSNRDLPNWEARISEERPIPLAKVRSIYFVERIAAHEKSILRMTSRDGGVPP
jgi:hypothetical protein